MSLFSLLVYRVFNNYIYLSFLYNKHVQRQTDQLIVISRETNIFNLLLCTTCFCFPIRMVVFCLEFICFTPYDHTNTGLSLRFPLDSFVNNTRSPLFGSIVFNVLSYRSFYYSFVILHFRAPGCERHVTYFSAFKHNCHNYIVVPHDGLMKWGGTPCDQILIRKAESRQCNE